jgi:hypothetical protein
MLVARWGLILRPLRVPIDKSAQDVVVCMKLHNFIIECCEKLHSDSTSSSEVPEPRGVDYFGNTDPAGMEIHLQDDLDTDESLHKRRRDREQCVVRSHFTQLIEDLGVARPF